MLDLFYYYFDQGATIYWKSKQKKKVVNSFNFKNYYILEFPPQISALGDLCHVTKKTSTSKIKAPDGKFGMQFLHQSMRYFYIVNFVSRSRFVWDRDILEVNLGEVLAEILESLFPNFIPLIQAMDEDARDFRINWTRQL